MEHHLRPGKAAVVAEVDEQRVLPLEARMEAEGGLVFSQPRTEVEDLLIERDLAARRVEIAALHAEYACATGDARAQLLGRIETVERRLQAAIQDAEAAITEAGRTAEAKARRLEEAAAAGAGDQAQLQAGAAHLRADHDRRRARLQRALAASQARGATRATRL